MHISGHVYTELIKLNEKDSGSHSFTFEETLVKSKWAHSSLSDKKKDVERN